MIRITTHQEPSHTVVTIDGRLTAVDLRAIRRSRKSISGAVALDLGGLDACAEDGIRLLQDWLDAGARLDAATPFLRMVLQDRKVRDSPAEHPPVTSDPDSPTQPP
ncbi:MAG TPA: hypothetical protein P5102_17695 [Candidatus Competibacteraceae bacterium]|nr:hypothetical protein [Candidatus Competibacteraceae bacterium]HRZ07940.1 hypothetical protein [Candidatus Competibacteraceae bacterium]